MKPLNSSDFLIWVDADSCPCPIRDLIIRFAKRLSLKVYFIANRPIPLPTNPLVTMICCSTEQDAADNYIVENASCGDIVITRDIPLADRLVKNNICVINDRGVVYTEANIAERLSVRNFMLDLYNNGIMPERTSQLGKKELHDFANCFDKEIQKLLHKKQ